MPYLVSTNDKAIPTNYRLRHFFQTGLLLLNLMFLGQSALGNESLPSTGWTGVVDLGGTAGENTNSWRLENYGFADTDDNAINFDAQLAVNVALGSSTRAFIQGQLVSYDGDEDDSNPGLVQAYLEQLWQPGAATVKIRAGQFFLPTSLENNNALWLAEYTQTLSAINTWFAQEFRPIGLKFSVQPAISQRNTFDFMLFQGNDATGSQLAWRGWALGQRLSVTGETLPLGNIPALSDTGSFSEQKDGGSTAFGRDLDNRTGYSLGWRAKGDKLRGRLYWVDTRGDRQLHRGEYAWDTRFLVAGASWSPAPEWTLQAEAIRGKSGMGETNSAKRVDIDFAAVYAMASWQLEPFVISLRFDRFEVDDRDPNPEDLNDENGDVITAALFWREAQSSWRLGIEYVHAAKERAMLEPDQELKLRLWQLEARYYFQR